MNCLSLPLLVLVGGGWWDGGGVLFESKVLPRLGLSWALLGERHVRILKPILMWSGVVGWWRGGMLGWRARCGEAAAVSGAAAVFWSPGQSPAGPAAAPLPPRTAAGRGRNCTALLVPNTAQWPNNW